MSLSVSSNFFKFFGVITMFYTYRFTFAVSQKLIIRLILTLDIYSLVANRRGGWNSRGLENFPNFYRRGGAGIVEGWKIVQILIAGRDFPKL